MNTALPEVGSWYRTADGGKFEIIAVDEADQSIDIQHFDGTLEELDMEAWLELMAEPADPPEDWTGPLDLDPEDGIVSDEPHQAWSDPLDFVDENDDL